MLRSNVHIFPDKNEDAMAVWQRHFTAQRNFVRVRERRTLRNATVNTDYHDRYVPYSWTHDSVTHFVDHRYTYDNTNACNVIRVGYSDYRARANTPSGRLALWASSNGFPCLHAHSHHYLHMHARVIFVSIYTYFKWYMYLSQNKETNF